MSTQNPDQTAESTPTNPVPTPPALQAQATANDLKARLDWGEPALTIIDVRDRTAFNQEHIMGAIHMPATQLAEQAKASLELSRDIYVYGGEAGDTALAATTLREAGFQNVAELQGGLSAWKEVSGPVEGTSS